LNLEPDLQVVGDGGDEDQVVEMLATSPDLLLFDYEALGANSESIISRLRRTAPRIRVLVIATRSSDEYVERVLRAGASGLVGKQLGFDTISCGSPGGSCPRRAPSR
ncbi:MAG: response regulator, partial [Vicinamibacteria bacterium]